MIKQYWNQLRLRSGEWKLSGIKSRFDGLREPTIYETFAVLCCFEQHLVLSSIKVSHSSMQVENCLIDLPSHLIGDVRVEDFSDLTNYSRPYGCDGFDHKPYFATAFLF